MKNIFAFILLLAHVNFSMFIAQLDEVDAYDRSGQQQEDINSLTQYLAEAFHIKHRPLKDSDDDSARYFHVSKFDEFNFAQLGAVKKDHFTSARTKFPPYIEDPTSRIFLDRQGPPPKI